MAKHASTTPQSSTRRPQSAGSTPASSPLLPIADAGLLAACDDFSNANAEQQAAGRRDGDSEVAIEAAGERWSHAVSAVTDAQATTWRGIAAKAEALAAVLLYLAPDLARAATEDGCEEEHRLAWSLCQDIAGIASQAEGGTQ